MHSGSKFIAEFSKTSKFLLKNASKLAKPPILILQFDSISKENELVQA
jgi:hypothetical protein